MGGWGATKLGLRLYQQKCQIRTWTAVTRAYVVPTTIRGDWCPDEHWIAQCKLLSLIWGNYFIAAFRCVQLLSMDCFCTRTVIKHNALIHTLSPYLTSATCSFCELCVLFQSLSIQANVKLMQNYSMFVIVLKLG
jgi:hypothetical protein